jgi:hypothetical protein
MRRRRPQFTASLARFARITMPVRRIAMPVRRIAMPVRRIAMPPAGARLQRSGD